jgi:hypothetical protein
MRYQAALRPDRMPLLARQGGFSANGSDAASRLARRPGGADTGPMTKAVPNQPQIAMGQIAMGQIAMGKRVLAFSSIGHALMHMMTAFYAVIVLTLAIAWGRSMRRPPSCSASCRCRPAGQRTASVRHS